MAKVGFIGFAHGHVMGFGGLWKENPEQYGIAFGGGWDRDPARRDEACAKLGTEPFETVEALLASDIDAVVIGTETAYHAEFAVKAAEAGKDIVLYKPMALRMADADRIVEAVKENGVRFTMGWQARTDPQNIKMREMVRGHALGETYLFRRRHSLNAPLWPGLMDTWHVNPLMNRDIFADDAAHPVDYMMWTFGMPDTVMCEMSSMYDPRLKNDNDVALFRYANGMIAEIACSFTTVAAEATTEIYLNGGTILQSFGDMPSTLHNYPADQPGLKWLKIGDKDWTDSAIPSPERHFERISGQAGPLADFLNKKRGPVASAEEGRDCLRLILACYLSAQDGRRVSVWDPRVYEV